MKQAKTFIYAKMTGRIKYIYGFFHLYTSNFDNLNNAAHGCHLKFGGSMLLKKQQPKNPHSVCIFYKHAPHYILTPRRV